MTNEEQSSNKEVLSLYGNVFNPNEHMIKLKGKDYLPVAWRLAWFRSVYGVRGSIKTEIIHHDREQKSAEIKACIYIDGVLVSEDYGTETIADFGDYFEKAVTKAKGRALADLGFGTQFAQELDELPRIVDSPQPTKETQTQSNPNAKKEEKLKILFAMGKEKKLFASSGAMVEFVAEVVGRSIPLNALPKMPEADLEKVEESIRNAPPAA